MTAPRETSREIDRRKLLKAGVSGLAGATVLAWTKPAISSVRVVAQGFTPAAGNPSIEVDKTVTSVTDLGGGTYEISGTITITNVTDSSIPVTIESITDYVEFRSGGGWQTAPTEAISMPCGPGTVIPAAGQQCSGPYTVRATGLPPTGGKRNVVEVRAVNRDKTFLDRASFDF